LRTRREAPVAPAAEQLDNPVEAEDLAVLVDAIAALPVGVVVEDAAGRVVARNSRAEAPFREVQADALATEALRRLLARARAGERASDVLELRSPTPRSLEMTAWPLTAGGVAAVVVDDSERRRLDAIRRDFVANVNHELRTPIGALGVLAEALADETNLAVVQRLAGRVHAEVQRAHHLIEELLDFSRIEADSDGGSDDVDVAELVATALESVAAQAERRRVLVRRAPVEGAVVVRGSRPQLLSAITNLLDNAIKYSDERGVVDVVVAASGAGVSVTVRDEGIGIPAKDLDRVFERFYRVDASRDRRTGGTGLGLAIVRHVAANHGGTVDVSSVEGAGSTFTLRLPVA
jgi:two-component system sensor histidine kinase SenX3